MVKIKSSEITPEHIYMSRRRFMRGAGALAFSSLVLAACGGGKERLAAATPADPTATTAPPTATPTPDLQPATPQSASVEPTDNPTAVPQAVIPDRDELGDPLNSFEAITNFNNFYEFTIEKEKVAMLAKDFKSSPWTVEVGGLVHNPKTFDLDDLRTFDQENRVYRLRCVEGWSMVIPWLGFPLHKLLKEVEPMSQAKYVRFETVYDPEQMPGQKGDWFNWPYVEGLRMDEAMHDLALMATGLYGKELLPQNGAPFRLVVPWKYGFKSIKSIVKIEAHQRVWPPGDAHVQRVRRRSGLPL
jgi:sulfoxide reductase catalytic subunit YedY